MSESIGQNEQTTRKVEMLEEIGPPPAPPPITTEDGQSSLVYIPLDESFENKVQNAMPNQ